MEIELIKVVLPSLLGALLGFFFVWIASFFSRKRDRYVNHYNAIIKIGVVLNNNLALIHSNIYTLPGFANSITEGKIFWGSLSSLELKEEYLLQLHDIELANELASYLLSASRVNMDILNISNGYSEIKKAYIERNIDKETYINNAEIIKQYLEIIQNYLEDFKNDGLELQAKIRIKIKKEKPMSSSVISYLINRHIYTPQQSEIAGEKKTIEAEVEELSKEYAEKIKNIVK